MCTVDLTLWLCPQEVTLQGSDLEKVMDGRYFGATVGRIANRVANAKFTVEGKVVDLGRRG
jgi:galactose mutarotase-like enzyme